VLGVVVVLVGGVLAGLWWVSTSGVSPEQRIADAEPPPPPVVVVEVEERYLNDSVVFRGTVVGVDSVEIGAPELSNGSAPVVVELPLAVGERVGSSGVVAVVSDRPVIVVSMPVPLYRTLLPGVVGEDVARFQEMLVGEGFEVVIDGRFGRESQEATVEFYEGLGFAAVRTGEELDEALRAAEDGVRAARLAVEDARQVGGTTLARARDELRAAEEARDRAAVRVGVVVPLGEVVGVGGLPATVSSVDTRVGEVVEGPVLRLTTSELVVDAVVDSRVAALLAPGVEAMAGDGGEWGLVVVSNDGQDDQGRSVVRLEAADPIPADLLGADVRVEAVLAATEGPVVAVPVTAVRSGSDGEFVRVVEPDGSVREVGVTPGMSIGGWVEIAGSEGELVPGMLVRAG
jgi:hypothetical protein